MNRLSPAARAGLIGFCWCLAGLVLAFAARGKDGLSVPGLSILYTSALFMLAAEALVLAFALSALKTLWMLEGTVRRAVARVAAIAAVFLLTIILSLAIISWTFGATGSGFLQPSTVTTALLDSARLSDWMTSLDTILLTTALAGGAATSIVLFWFARPLSVRERARVLAGLALCVGVLTLCARVLVPQLTGRETERVHATLRVGLLPSSPLWSRLLLPVAPAPVALDVPLVLRRAPEGVVTRSDRPNFLLISIESLRGGEETRVVDGEVVMPTVSRLAREGVHFVRGYAPSNESAYS